MVLFLKKSDAGTSKNKLITFKKLINKISSEKSSGKMIKIITSCFNFLDNTQTFF